MISRARVELRLPLSVLLFLTLAVPPVGGATLVPVGFDEMVSGADLIVRATVVEKSCFERSMGTGGANRRVERDRVGRAPAPRPRSASEAAPLTARPVGLGTEGGRMIFTEVVLVVDEVLEGTAGDTITLTHPGGTVDGRRAIVFGLPAFVPGEEYLLFLRPGYESAGDPVVGVSQGFFSIVIDEATGEEILLDADGRAVVGIEDDHVLARRLQISADAPRQVIVGPPTPGPGYEGVVHASRVDPAPRRKNATPMRLSDFRTRIRAAVATASREVR